MRRFKNILFVPEVSDRSSDLYDLAVSIARTNDARLTILGVVPPAPPQQENVQLGTPPRTITELLETEAVESLASHAKNYTDGPPIEVDVVHGQPATEIVRRVVDLDHDLLVLTADGSEEQETLVRRVLRTCRCPVQILRRRVETGNVLAALDPNGHSELNLSILKRSRMLSTEARSDLHIVHSWEVYGETALMTSEHIDVEMRELAEYATEVQETHRRQLDALLERAGEGLCSNVHLINGSPADAIGALVDLYRIDLLVMGSVGRSSTDGLSVGNTAESVFGDVGCSVLVIKPSDFVVS